MNAKNRNEKSVILKNIIVTILVLTFFVGILILFYRKLYDEKRDNIIKDGEMAAGSAADQIDKYLSTNIDSIKMSAFTLDQMITENKSDEEIQDFLVGQSTAIRSAVLENATGLYGYINGRFFSGTNWEPPEDYDATARPWYTKPMANKGNITMLDPYIDVQSGNVMLAVGKTLCDDKSVISVDISLDKIQQITEEAVASGESDVEMIINDKGIVVAHSDIGEAGKDYNAETGTLGAEILDKLDDSDTNYFELNFRNYHYIVYAASLMDGWHCISVKDATAVFDPLRRVLALTVAAVIAAIITISLIMINSNRRQLAMERLSKQLSATADIYISMHEINFLTDTFTEVRNNQAEASAMIGESRTNSQEVIRTIMSKFTDDISRDAVLDFIDFSTLDARLSNRNTITLEWLSMDKKWRRSRFIASERTPEGKLSSALYLIEDIDAEKSESDKVLDTAQQLANQIRSIANIYTSVHDIDFINNSFATINISDTVVENMIGKDISNAQEVLKHAMTGLTDESCLKDVLTFVEFDNIEKNVAETGTATIEFLSSRGKWCRGRFIVSKRTDDGRLSHVLWAVENIDAEKRERDKLTEAAQTLNERISSITNIYMTAHELDIQSDTFYEIKSQSDVVNDIIGETRTHAQEMLLKVMENVTDESSIEDIRRFIDLSTLEKRMRRTNTIAIEYMNKEKLWRRARFVASKRDDNGRLTRVLWLSEDIDNEKQERDKLLDMSERAIAASEAKSYFLSNMSQQIRTPIDDVLKMNDLILNRAEDSEIQLYSKGIKTAGSTLLYIVNNILDFSKIEAGKMEIVPKDYDFARVLAELTDMVKARAERKNLKVILEIDAEIPGYLHGDEVRIKQIITNILANAVEYTEQGAVTFGVGYEKIPDEEDSILLDVFVMDTGIGIKREDMKKLLSAFDRIEGEDKRNDEGVGLGLSITKRLLEMMDSNLEVESVYELGSKFSFKLKQKVVKWERIGDHPDETGRNDLPDSDEKVFYEMFKDSPIDAKAGLKNSGSADAYMVLLKIFYDAIDESTETINRLHEEGDLKNYAIKVHALKSSARIIGAVDFGEEAQALENAGKDEDTDYISKHHDGFMKEYAVFKGLLAPLCESSEDDDDKPEADAAQISAVLYEIKDAAEDMDCERLEELLDGIKEYRIPDDRAKLFGEIADAADRFDYDAIVSLLGDM